jgi:mono/diheme cytochrome c family protein
MRTVALRVSLVAIGVVASGCYPKAGPPPAALTESSVATASARWPGATAGALSVGRDLFLAKCDECHGYPDLVAVAEDRWPRVLDGMARKAHLSPDERDEVLHYVLASRSEQAGR